MSKFTAELRDARLNLGRSQERAAELAGTEQSTWSRIESGRQSVISLELAGRMAAVVGLDLVVQLFASDVRLRDAAQLALLRALRREMGPDWTWRFEVPRAGPADQRAWDAVATHRDTGLTVRVEAETRLRDCQATMRRIEAKRTADGQPRVILLLAATTNNGASVRAAADTLGTAFQLDTRRALVSLRSGLDPGGDALIMVWVGRDQRSQIETDAAELDDDVRPR